MNTATPIKNPTELTNFKNYYNNIEHNYRNMLLICIGLNTALRISDILALKWTDVYDSAKNEYFEHILLTEQKTDKLSRIYMNRNIINALTSYKNYLDEHNTFNKNDYLFKGRNTPVISRVQAYRIIKKAADACDIYGTISPHSLRKTFGYYAWKNGVEPVLLMNIFNHSSFSITQRYLGIEQDDRDEVFKKILL